MVDLVDLVTHQGYGEISEGKFYCHLQQLYIEWFDAIVMLECSVYKHGYHNFFQAKRFYFSICDFPLKNLLHMVQFYTHL